jgi:DNA-directed RNA polymerase subunit RPC12/RpoP
MTAFTDPITGWTATFHCNICGLHYPVQVLPPNRPKLPCTECGHKDFRRVKPKRGNHE